MSYTVSIYNKSGIDGGKVFERIADFSHSFLGDTEKPSEGFTTENGGTSFGLVWKLQGNDFSEVRERLRRMGKSTTCYDCIVRSFYLGNWENPSVGTINFLLAEPDIRFLASVLDGITSDAWWVEQTAWKVHREQVLNDASLAPPYLIHGRRASLLFTIGSISSYYDPMNTYDIRGPREAQRSFETIAGVPCQSFFVLPETHQDLLERSGSLKHFQPDSSDSFVFEQMIYLYGQEEACRLLSMNEYIGMKHSNTLIYYDQTKDELRAAHMHHEGVDRWRSVKTTDSEGNSLFIVGTDVTLRRFEEKWAVPLRDVYTDIGRVHIQTVVEGQSVGVERRR